MGSALSAYRYHGVYQAADHNLRHRLGRGGDHAFTISSSSYVLTAEHRRRLVEELGGRYPSMRVWEQADANYEWGYFPVIKCQPVRGGDDA